MSLDHSLSDRLGQRLEMTMARSHCGNPIRRPGRSDSGLVNDRYISLRSLNASLEVSLRDRVGQLEMAKTCES